MYAQLVIERRRDLDQWTGVFTVAIDPGNKGRARIEQAIRKLKRFKRVALRCEKTKRNFASFVALAAGFILLKSVHTAQQLSLYHGTVVAIA